MKTWLTDTEAKAICRHRAMTNQYIAKRLASGTQVPREEWTKWAHEYDAARQILRVLAGLCDGAKEHDGVGFNKIDARKGHALARQNELTNVEFWQAVNMSRKYHRQIDAELTSWIPSKSTQHYSSVDPACYKRPRKQTP